MKQFTSYKCKYGQKCQNEFTIVSLCLWPSVTLLSCSVQLKHKADALHRNSVPISSKFMYGQWYCVYKPTIFLSAADIVVVILCQTWLAIPAYIGYSQTSSLFCCYCHASTELPLFRKDRSTNQSILKAVTTQTHIWKKIANQGCEQVKYFCFILARK